VAKELYDGEGALGGAVYAGLQMRTSLGTDDFGSACSISLEYANRAAGFCRYGLQNWDSVESRRSANVPSD